MSYKFNEFELQQSIEALIETMSAQGYKVKLTSANTIKNALTNESISFGTISFTAVATSTPIVASL